MIEALEWILIYITLFYSKEIVTITWKVVSQIKFKTSKRDNKVVFQT